MVSRDKVIFFVSNRVQHKGSLLLYTTVGCCIYANIVEPYLTPIGKVRSDVGYGVFLQKGYLQEDESKSMPFPRSDTPQKKQIGIFAIIKCKKARIGKCRLVTFQIGRVMTNYESNTSRQKS